MDVEITSTGTIEVGRDHAIKYGVPGASDPVLAGFLLNLAERDGVITVTHGVIATLVEAAARIDGDTYLAWWKQREALSVEP